MAYDPTKPSESQGSMTLITASTRENLEALRTGLATYTKLNLESTMGNHWLSAKQTAQVAGAKLYAGALDTFLAVNAVPATSGNAYDTTPEALNTNAWRLRMGTTLAGFVVERAVGQAGWGTQTWDRLFVVGDDGTIFNYRAVIAAAPSAVAWFNVRDYSAAPTIGSGPAFFFTQKYGATLANTIYMGRVGASLVSAVAGSETTNLQFSYTAIGFSLATALGMSVGVHSAVTGIVNYLDTYRSGAEVGESGATLYASAAAQVQRQHIQFKHRRITVPTVTLSASGSGIADANLTSAASAGITVHGFALVITAAAAGVVTAFRVYTTSA